MSIDYSERIPNNVDLAEDRRLQRALESWQPRFLQWWGEMGPTLPTQDVYLRTAVDVGRAGSCPPRETSSRSSAGQATAMVEVSRTNRYRTSPAVSRS